MNDWTKIGSYIKDYFKGITPKYVVNSDLAVLNQRCIRDNQINYSLMQHTDTSYSVNHNKIIKNGDILICSTGQGTAGRCALVYDLPTDCKITVDSHVLVLRCECIEIASSINNILFSQERLIMSFLSGSSGQAELDRIRVFDLKIKIPNSANELNKINQIFRQLQKKISLNNRINDNLEQLAKTLYDYWFVQFEFPDTNGKPYKTGGGKMVWNEKLKRDIPEEWEVKSLNDITINYRGVSYNKEDLLSNPNEGVLVLRGNNIQENRLVYDNNVAYIPSSFMSEEQSIKKHDIIMTMSSGSKEHIGKCVMFQFNSLHTYGAFLTKFTPNNECPYFVFQIMNSDYFKAKIKNICGGTGINNLTNQTFDEVLCVYPPKEILSSFEKYLNSLYMKIGINDLEVIRLTQMRDWLLPMLMNEQIKVSN